MSFCKPNKNFITTKQNIRIKKNIVPPSVKKKINNALHFAIALSEESFKISE